MAWPATSNREYSGNRSFTNRQARTVNQRPIMYCNVRCYSFKQIDGEQQMPKGTAFRAFKHSLPILTEGTDYFYLDAEQQRAVIEPLRESGLIYRTTRHLVLLTESASQHLCMDTDA